MRARLWNAVDIARASTFIVALFALASTPAASAELRLLLDADNNVATGCTVATPAGAFPGVERVFITTVDTTTTPPRVTGVARQDCVNPAAGTFGPASAVSGGGWNVGVGTGTSGSNVIETSLPYPPGAAAVRLGVVYDDPGLGAEALIVSSSGGPIVIAAAVVGDPNAIPTLSEAMMAVLALLLGVVAYVHLRRHGVSGAPLAIFVLVMVSTVTWAAIVLDGFIGDWSGTPPTVTNPAGSQVAALFTRVEGGTMFVRVDTRTGLPPIAVADNLTATPGTTLNVSAGAGLLSNDNRGAPTASIAFFGGGSLGGAVTGQAAGSPTAFGAGRSLTVFADGSLALTLPAGFTGTVSFNYRLTNVNGTSDATVTIAAREAPLITSAASAAFTIGAAGTFTVTASGSPASTFAASGALPSGVLFNTATGVLSGTPAAGTAGTYPITFTAANGVSPNATQAFTLTVNQGASITSAAAATFTTGAPGTFTITTSGTPVANTIAAGGALPGGVLFTNNGDGTATLAGTPGAAAGGTYVLALSASNGVGAPATQSFTLTVNQPPALTSANAATFVSGTAGTFTITTTGFPRPAITESGALPSGLLFTDNGNGTATLAGTPTVAGSFPIVLTAANGVGANASQPFTITVNQSAVITSSNAATFTVGALGTFSITTSATPVATVITAGGALPTGVNFTNNGNGTATLTGTPGPGTGGIYVLTVGASNGVGAAATQTLTLTVLQAPAITSAAGVTFLTGQANSFTVMTTGFPAAAISATGALPAGVNLVDNGNGSASLAGNPASGSGGAYALLVSASNGVAPAASQPFTLTVQQAPTALGDAYSVAHDTVLTVVAPGVLVNDTGSPAPSVTSVTGSGPACTVFPCAIATAQGSASVNADGSFAYTPAAGFAGADAFTYVIGNVVGTSGATVSLTVTNAAPVVDLNGPAAGIDFGPVTFTEAAGPVPIVDPAQLTVTDADSTELASATIVITNPLDGASESVAVTCLPPGPACSGAILPGDIDTSVPATITITRAAPLADYQALLRTLTYNNTALNPTTSANRDITVTVNDGISDNAPLAHALVTLSAVNNAPTIAAPASVVTPTNTAFVFAGTVSVADPDAGTSAVQVVLTGTNGTATLSGTAGLVVLGNGTSTVTATGPVASQNAALSGMTFTPTASYSGPASLKIDIDDQGNTGSGGPKTATRTVAITVDNIPSVTGTIPAAGATSVSTTATITVNFSEPVTATVASFALECPVGTPKTFVLSSSPSASFVLVPTSAMPAATACRVTVIANQVADSVGQHLAADFTTTFTTNTLPTVIATSPVNAATGVNTASAVSVTFSEPVAATAASFTLECPSGTPRAYTLSASPAAVFTLTPGAPLPPGTACAVTVIAAQVLDADAGQAMASNFPFTFTTGSPPTITSANNATFKVGTAGSFVVTTTGSPSGASMSITQTGALPAGVLFTNNNDGTATLAGTPAAATGGTYPITITANNGLTPNATQAFTLTVQQAPAITSANATTFTLGQAGTFTVSTTGFPTNASMSITQSGALPAGVTLTNNNNGTATLAGTPGASGVFPITITANNGVTPNATQSFTLTVNGPPSITSANNATFKVGVAGSLTVTTTGTPSGASMSITETGALPAGVLFTNNNDGTATLAGTPAAATGGTYSITITANNGIPPNATQPFTLTVQQAPSITSASSTTFTLNQAGTFTVTTTGFPTNASMSITETGALPAGVTFVNNGNGTATLAGTPTANGSFPITITANNGVTPNATQSFTLTVNGPPAITSANNATFKVGTAGSFTVSTTGTPSGASMSITETGALPAGVLFTNNNDGTATIAGTPGAGTGGSYPITITANNGVPPNATQPFTLTVQQAPSITSANSTAFTLNQPGTFTVTTTGFPTNASMSITETGALPAGVTFVNNNNGTATLAGTPTANGSFPITITANNGVTPNATQSFTLTVNAPPTITSANNATFSIGSLGSFTVTTTGTPGGASMSLTELGALPTGVTFTNNNDGTATITGTPAPGTGGTYPITITANNGVAPNATQVFTLTVNQAPAITSASATTFTLGQAGTFTVTTTGFPTNASMSITQTGALPAGVTFVNNGNGTATLAGTPTVNGTFPITITANNGVTPNATQSFTLTVNGPPAITSANNATFSIGSLGSFTVTTTGTPGGASMSITGTGALPTGVTFTNNNDGTATIAGTPGAGTGGSYPITITANNGVAPNATQAFTLTVNQAPSITSASATTFTLGQSGTFSVTTVGFPTNASMSITQTGALPAGVTFVNNNNGTATLAGTPTASGSFPITITANNAVAPNATQSFTLTVNGPPTITSANSATFPIGSLGSFTVTTTGTPGGASMSITQTGALPTGVTFTNNNDGTATIAGTPAVGTGGSYPITITANNGVAPNATQAFTLTVNQAPSITSANNATFALGQSGTFSVTTVGFPTNASMSITQTGALPAGVTFVNNNNGTATLAGTPTASGSFPITITANNGVAPNATQGFTLLVTAAPAITSANNVTFLAGVASSFSVTTTGSPTVTSIVRGGTLPTGISFTYTSGANGTLSGSSTAIGSYPLSFTASNGIAPDAVQNPFTLNIACPVIVVSPSTLPNSFAGDPYGPVTFSATGGSGSYAFALGPGAPPGLVFTGANLGGTPTDVGTFSFDVTATDTVTGCSGVRSFVNVQLDLIANNDSIGNIIGNVLVDSAIAGFTVTTNDQFPSGATITAFDATSLQGGTVTMVTSGAGMGQFTYDPPRGYVGADSFTYTLAKNGRSSIGTVSFNVSGMAWFINNTVGACVSACDGRMSHPYTLLSTFVAANAGAAPAPQPNDTIFLYTGAAAYTGTTTLRQGQRFIGQGASQTLATLGGLTAGLGQALPNTGGINPNVNAAFTFTTGNSLQGFDMDGASATLSATSATGFAVNLGRFRRTGTTSNAILLAGTGNTGTYSFRSITTTGLTGSANNGVAIQNLTGSFTVQGNDSGVSPSGGTISAFGGNGMDFRNVATCTPVGGCSGTSVALFNMNVSGNGISQAVSGNNVNCGGAIVTGSNVSCVANLFLRNVDGVAITGSTFNSGGQVGINGNNVYDFSLTSSTVQNNGNEAAESGILFQNLHGISSIGNSTVNGNAASQVVVGMTNAGSPSSPLTLTVSSGNFANGAAGANTASGFVLTGAAAGTTTLNISGSTFANYGGGNGLDITAGTTTAPLNLSGQVGTSTFASSANGVSLQVHNSSAVSFNTVNNPLFTGMTLQSILYQTNSTATGVVQGRITGNTIGNQSLAGSACNTGPANCGGIVVSHSDAGGNTNTSALQVTISGNTIQEIVNGYGIDVFGGGAGSAHTLISGNTLRTPRGTAALQLEAIDVNYSTGTPTTIQVCSSVTGNTISNGSIAWGAGLSGSAIHLRQRNTVNVRLPGYGGAANDTNAVQAFVSGSNGGATVAAEIDFTATGYLGGAACITP